MEIKVSQLPAAVAAQDSDTYMVVQVSTSRKQTLAQLKTALGVANANLQALAGLTYSADRLPYATGVGTMSLAVFTPFARTLLDDADQTAAQATLGVQPTASPQFTGTSKNDQITISASSVAPTLYRQLKFQTSGSDRFNLTVDGAESTANVGSDFIFGRYSDAGAFLGRILSVTRATGNMSLGNVAVDATATLLVGGSLSIAGPVKPGQYTLTTLPSASTYSGYEIDVTNATGGPKRCRSNGTVWQILNTTTTVS